MSNWLHICFFILIFTLTLNSMCTENFQLRLERAVIDFEKKHAQKPSLLQINRNDYWSLLPCRDETSRCGLAIRGVSTIGLEGVESGQYHFVP
jgi:hypothetical protein